MTNPIPTIPPCGKGTFNGAAAEASKYLFASCVLPMDHAPPCDSGPAPEPTQQAAA